MDAATRYNYGKLSPLTDQMLKRKNPCENLDRFIPNRSAMDFDFAHYMLTTKKMKKSESHCSPAKEAYRKQLAKIFNMNRSRILAFRNKPPASRSFEFQEQHCSSSHTSKQMKRYRTIPQSSEKTLDAPDIVDDFYLNLLDWGANNFLAIALANSVYIWDASNGSTSELVVVDNEIGPVTSVKWSPDGRHLAVGLNNSHVQIWDSVSGQLERTLRDGHRLRVGSLDWNNCILTSGGRDSLIINNDIRIRSHNIGTYRGHTQEICGLKWSESGKQLASGGNDTLVHIWSLSKSSRSTNQWLHRLTDHSAAVKALAWCPFQSNLIASGGGVNDHCIKFWNIKTGSCVNSVDTGSQVCSLLWNRHEHEILSSHGFNDNQLILWKYPSMGKIKELHGHTSRVLHMEQSPDGYTVATAAADETLRLWNVFGTPELAKPAPKSNPEPFSNISRIR